MLALAPSLQSPDLVPSLDHQLGSGQTWGGFYSRAYWIRISHSDIKRHLWKQSH
jgi:hypothetical protein